MQRPGPNAESPYSAYWRQLGETVAAIFVVAILGNYPWELAQAPLYAGMASFRAMWWHCFVASLGDGLLILGIFATGWIALGQQMWFVHPGVQGYGVMLTTGLVIGGVIEWVAVHLMERWMYTAQMPLVPGLAIGVVPVAQMLGYSPENSPAIFIRGGEPWLMGYCWRTHLRRDS